MMGFEMGKGSLGAFGAFAWSLRLVMVHIPLFAELTRKLELEF